MNYPFTNSPVAALDNAARNPGLPRLSRLLITFAAAIALWSLRRNTRHHLSNLDDHALADIGLSREAAERESMKRFWMP